MQEFDLQSWEELEERIADLKTSHLKAMLGLLFRGQGNKSWPLQTTLERRRRPKFRIHPVGAPCGGCTSGLKRTAFLLASLRLGNC